MICFSFHCLLKTACEEVVTVLACFVWLVWGCGLWFVGFWVLGFFLLVGCLGFWGVGEGGEELKKILLREEEAFGKDFEFWNKSFIHSTKSALPSA